MIGAGFIGLEAAATARQAGCSVTVLEGAAAPLMQISPSSGVPGIAYVVSLAPLATSSTSTVRPDDTEVSSVPTSTWQCVPHVTADAASLDRDCATVHEVGKAPALPTPQSVR